MVTSTFTYNNLVKTLQSTLQSDSRLSYVDDKAIIYTDEPNDIVFPEFKDYLIVLSPPESGFLIKVPKIGQYFTNNYIVAIQLWVKAPQNVASGMNRLLSGSLIGRQQKSPTELFRDVSSILEHNTLSDSLDAYPGSNIGDPVALSDKERQMSGVGFMWLGRQNNVA